MRRREREAAPGGSTGAPAGAGGDTKVCPYCAEVIKAAAIRCRYCQSDLTEAPPTVTPAATPSAPSAPSAPPVDLAKPEPADLAAAPAPAPAPTPAPTPPPAVPARPSAHRTGGPSRAVATVAVVAAVVLTLVFGVLAFLAWHEKRDLEAASDAGRTVRATLPEKLKDVLSYDFQTFDDDKARALAQLTPSFRSKYEDTLDAIQERATEQRRTQDAEVVAVAVVKATPDKVTTLVFVNRTTSTAGSDKTQILQDRLNATVVRRDGKWLIDTISFPTS